jgi:Histidine-specific methyltransferase, SAM-dependent
MPSAFVVMPYREPFESVYSSVISPALKDAGIAAVRADQTSTSSDIMADVRQQILASELIIVEATHPNPNVYFEFGFAYANDKEFVLLAQKNTDLPFDTRQIRHLMYDVDGMDLLKADFARWLSTTKVVQQRQKRTRLETLNRGEVFSELFDSAILMDQFSAPMEKIIMQEIRRGEMMPCSHSYSTDIGADSWLRLCADPLYTVFQESIQFLDDSVDAIFDSLPTYIIRSNPDFVSLGPGDGFKDRTLLRGLSNKVISHGLNEFIYYYPVDISPRILSTAISTVSTDSDLREKLKIKALLGDFEKLRLFAPAYDFRPEPNIFSLLGNTLGNLAHDGDFLKKIHGTMHDGDILLLEVRTKQSKLSLSGKTSNQFGLSFAPLGYLGVPYEQSKIEILREDALSQIPGTSSLAVHYKSFNLKGTAIDDLILSWVNFYDPEQLLNSLAGQTIGFKLLKIFELKSLVLIVLQK